jgi:hypothetical protein
MFEIYIPVVCSGLTRHNLIGVLRVDVSGQFLIPFLGPFLDLFLIQSEKRLVVPETFLVSETSTLSATIDLCFSLQMLEFASV